MNHTERAIVSLRILLWLASLLGNSLLLLSLLLLSGGLQTRRAKTAPSSAAAPSRSQRGRTFHLFLANLATANLVGTCLADMPDLVSIAMVETTRPRDLEGDVLTVVCPALKFASAVAETGAICFTLLICVYRYQKLCGWPAFSGGRGGDQGGGRTEEVSTEAGGGVIGEGRGVGGDGDRAAGGEGMSDIDGGGDGRGGGGAVFEEEADGGIFVGGGMRDVGRGVFGADTEGDKFGGGGGGLVIGGQIIEAASPQHFLSTIQRRLEHTNTTTITTTTNSITTTNDNNKNADLSAHKTRDRDSNPALRSAPLDQQRLARLCCLLAWATTMAFSLPSIFMGSEWEAPNILMPYSINSTSSTVTNLTSSSFTNLSSSSTNSSSLSKHRDTCPSDLFTCPKARRCAVSHMAYKYIYLLGTNVCPLVVVFVASLRIVLTLLRSRRAAVMGPSFAEPSSGGGVSVKTRGGSGPVLMALMLFEVSWCAHLALQFLADSDRLVYWSDADFFITGVYTSTSPYIFGIGSGLLPPKSPARATG